MSARSWSTIAVVSFVLAGCAGRAGTRHTRPPDSSLLTSEELATVIGTTQNAYSATERLRPLFLAVRPSGGIDRDTPPRLHVFVNGSLAGDVEMLKMIPLESVESIQRLQAPTAFTQLGETRTGAGVILVRLRR